MTWLAWRQSRIQSGVALLLALAAAGLLAVLQPPTSHNPRVSVFDLLTPTDKNLFNAGIVLLAVMPAVLGAFWGAPLVAREVEAGTHRLVWNQSTTRTRWLLTKVATTLVATVAVVGLLSTAVTLWAGPIDGALGSGRGGLPQRLTPVSFGMRGVAPLAYAVLAVSAGLLLGTVLRRVLPAMALTVGLVVFLQVAIPHWVRPHLLPATHETIVIARGDRAHPGTVDGISQPGPNGPATVLVHTSNRADWILDQHTVDRSGRTARTPASFGVCLGTLEGPAPQVRGDKAVVPVNPKDCFADLAAAGYRQSVTFLPAGRFWALQWVESSVLLVLSLLLVGLATWRVRRIS